jgi:hypothetical protein
MGAGLSPEMILVLVCLVTALSVGEAVVAGTKKVVHGVKHGIAKIVHPHRETKK